MTSDLLSANTLSTSSLRDRRRRMIVTADRIEASTERARKYGIVAVASRTRDVRPPAKLTAEQKERRYRSLLQETRSADQASRLLERVIGGNDLVGINYLSRGLVAARAVGRIHLRDAQGDDIGYGTGFLVAPGLALTNNHVFGSDADAATGILEFDYEKDVSGRDRPTHRFTFEPDRFFATSKELDFTLVAVAARSDTQRALSEFGWLPLRIEPGKAIVGEYLTIIQHPGGEQKQICVRENKLLKYLPDTIWYQTDTVAGSSGSPVFNNAWEVVALHHSGVPDTDKEGHWLTVDGKIWDSSMSEDKVRWLANEGIRISRIVEHLKANFPGEPLLAPIFRGQRPEAALLLLGGMSSTDPRPNGNG
ncbi:MAG TPA: serine protease, partial [Planctomycetota bacterium]|nr:serine protease [Planctomycetota bacterium]